MSRSGIHTWHWEVRERRHRYTNTLAAIGYNPIKMVAQGRLVGTYDQAAALAQRYKKFKDDVVSVWRAD